jgi:ATP-dependent DNA helicase RecG
MTAFVIPIPQKWRSRSALENINCPGLIVRRFGSSRRTKLVEGRGFGMRTLGAAAAKYGLPVPKYAFDGLYLNLTIYRHVQAAVAALGQAVLKKLSKSERSGWEWLATKATMTSTEYAKAMKLPYRTAMNHLRRFQQLGMLEKTGSGRTTEYKIIGA